MTRFERVWTRSYICLHQFNTSSFFYIESQFNVLSTSDLQPLSKLIWGTSWQITIIYRSVLRIPHIYPPIYSCGWVIYSVISQIRFDISQTLSEIYMSEQVRFVILINQEWWVEVRWQNSIDLLLNDKEFNEKSICFLTREPKLIECIQFLISKRFAALSNWKIVWN